MAKREFLQLADHYDPHKHNVAGWFVSEKLDGMRCFWDGGISRGLPTESVPWASVIDPRTGEKKAKIKPVATGLWSRYGNPIMAPDWWLNKLPACPLDGELWAGRGKFQLCRSICGGDTPDDRFSKIVFAVYSTPPLTAMRMWKIIQSQPEQLAALLWATPYTAANWREQPVGDIDQAVLLMAQGAQFYCGNGNSSTWSLDKCAAPHKPKPEVWADWFRRILPAANRLRGVQLLHEDALVAIERVYQNPEALLYVDPPYYGHENEYRYRIDYPAMVELLNSAKARVIVSEYPDAAEFYRNWNCIDRVTASRAGTGRHNYRGKTKTEVLFTNF